ncbi:hypothetical protein, partial [Lachnobacterium bovis]|uniref:hypothetical protein n=1 Tax=Lachnobacterium bovis TaxID=140626 RepID=UPI0004873418
MKEKNPNLYEKKKKVCSFFIVFSLVIFMGLMIVEVYAIRDFRKNLFVIATLGGVAFCAIFVAIIEILRLIKLYNLENKMLNEEIYKALKNMQIIQSENFGRFSSDIERVIQHNKEILDESVEDIFKVQKEVSLAIVKKNESSAQKTIDQNKENAEAIIAANIDIKENVNHIKDEIQNFYDHLNELKSDIGDKIEKLDNINDNSERALEICTKIYDDIHNGFDEKNNIELEINNAKDEIIQSQSNNKIDFPIEKINKIESDIEEIKSYQGNYVTPENLMSSLEKIENALSEKIKDLHDKVNEKGSINEKIDNLKMEVEESLGQLASNYTMGVEEIDNKINDLNDKFEELVENNEEDYDEIDDNAIAEEMMKLNNQISQQIEVNFAEMEKIIKDQAEEIKNLNEKYEQIIKRIEELDDKTEKFDAVIENSIGYTGAIVEGLPNIKNGVEANQDNSIPDEKIATKEIEINLEPEDGQVKVESEITPELEENIE